ncbi:periplasmic heavy metal sensor [Methylocaldum sp.]|uniref:periplasmic heavy metal sensor n=1 Tax=Methylocaldum sp. TaxID=1969727 RepID=UPI002D21F4E8|nr:periplasmic heavy metal sensor [Methylocaldum sp.]HYE35956.1 periplasmic heavy metal sensor [Methylocaldum sp.]
MKPFSLSSRTTAFILLGSLLLNVFLLAWLGVGAFKHQHRRPWLSMESFEERLTSRLPERDASTFRNALDAQRPELVSRIEAVRASRDEIRRTLQAEPFDREVLEAALTRSDRAMTALQATLHSVISTAAPELSGEGRRRLLEKRER